MVSESSLAMANAALTITIPDWVEEHVAAASPVLRGDEAKMGLAIALAAANVARGGGPFGAVVFEDDRVAGAGVNRVLDTGYSIAHAEIVAIMAAQQRLIGRDPWPSLTLVTSAEPCCQCFGAIVWAGVDRLVCGATTDEVQAIGFDEGPKPTDWQASLRSRGIGVTERVLGAQATGVLRDYLQRGGVIYGKRPARGARMP